MKVFVIIVTYNGSEWLDNCLGSLRKSTIPVTPVVIDNNSTDDTLKIIRSYYPEVHILESNENLGFGRANNLGIKYAIEKGADYLFLLNQDAWVLPDTIEKLVRANKQNPEYYILSPLHLSGNGKSLDYNFSVWIAPHQCPELVSDSVLKKVPENRVYPIKFVNAALWLLSKDCVQNIGGFDSIFSHYGEDNDYTFRVNYHGYKIGIDPTAIGIHSRNQSPVDLEKMTSVKRLNRLVNANFEILKNINKPFSICILKSISFTGTGFLKQLIKLKVANAIIEVRAAFRVYSNIYKAYKHREFSKVKGTTFLYNT